MKEYTVEEFCNTHKACKDGRDWAVANCATMKDAWLKAKPEWVVWIATRPGVLSDKDLRMFAVWSTRQVQHLMTDQRSIDALAVAERFANDLASVEELAAAGAAAQAAAWAAAWAAAQAAAWAALEAAQAAARAEAWAAQARYLQENTTPNFNKL